MDRKTIKYCVKCDKYLPKTDFNKDKQKRDGLYSTCRIHKKPSQDPKTKAIYDREYRKRTRMQKKANQYGVSKAYLEAALASQNDTCAICHKPEMSLHSRTKKPMSLAIDHNHATGKVRGYLCSLCNKAIGLFKDDIKLLKNAIDYLIRTDSV